MPINNIPGVGPTNADIATAVAAPSAATIAAAVAAPSSATIASAVAAAVPTTAGITSIVQANAGSPVGGTWTQIATTTANGNNSYTFTNLSGYKYLKLMWTSLHCAAGTQTMRITFNGVTTNTYNIFGEQMIGYNNGSSFPDAIAMGVNFPVENVETDYQRNNGFIEIPNSNSTMAKHVRLHNTSFSSYWRYYRWNGIWTNTSPISSITVALSASTFNFPTSNGAGFILIGAN